MTMEDFLFQEYAIFGQLMDVGRRIRIISPDHVRLYRYNRAAGRYYLTEDDGEEMPTAYTTADMLATIRRAFFAGWSVSVLAD